MWSDSAPPGEVEFYDENDITDSRQDSYIFPSKKNQSGKPGAESDKRGFPGCPRIEAVARES